MVGKAGRTVTTMAVRMPVRPELLAWAADRAGLADEELERRFPKFAEWHSGELTPTFKQLEHFAKAAHAPLGYFFLDEPPEEPIPIPDFRTMGNAQVRRASPDLLETIYLCQMRQDWYREHAAAEGFDPLSFVGSVDASTPVELVADDIRKQIGFGLDGRARFQNWEDARRQLIDSIEGLGVLVMVSGIVGGNTRRKLNPDEFRGFALSDAVVPLIFVNGADTKAAQIFTLMHELAHIWAGETALSDARMSATDGHARELWANRVAAEVLLPLIALRTEYRGMPDVGELQRIAKHFRVSTLVVLKRIFDAGYLTWDDYRIRYDEELERVLAIMRQRNSGDGGNWHKTQPLRISRHFARAVIVDALEGRTLYRDAYALLGTAKHETFQRMARELAVA